MVRDGRDVPDRRPDLRVARLRHDPRRRGGGARLADGAARGALAARRQRRPAARPVPRPAPPGRRARAVSGARSSIACCAGPPCRRPSRRACCSRWPLPALRAPLAPQGAESFPQSLTVMQDVPPDAGGVPRQGAAGERRRQGAERADAGGTERDRRAEAAGSSPAAGRSSRSRVDVNRAGHGREHHRPDRGERHRRRLERRLPRPARDDRPRDGRRPSGRGGGRDRSDRRVEGRRRRAEVEPGAGDRLRAPVRVRA